MELFKKKINKNNYEFVNEYWETSNAWGHKSSLFKNGHQIVENKVRYYNRTWEQYTYQTSMSGCVYILIENKEKELKEKFKEEKNITKLLSKYQKEYEKYKKNDVELKELLKLKNSLQWR